jgi:hypothetical protein
MPSRKKKQACFEMAGGNAYGLSVHGKNVSVSPK